MKKMLATVMACALSASLMLAGCGGESSVQGSATPIPGTDVPPVTDTNPPAPTPDATPAASIPAASTPANGADPKASRFTGVAPATSDNPKYVSSPAIAYQLGAVVTSPIEQEWAFDADGSPRLDENGKQVMVSTAAAVTPVQGWMRFPVASTSAGSGRARYPIVVFLHGQHTVADPSYQGYDYLAQDLAQQGYVVLSIDANAINGFARGDLSSQSRAQLLLGTLDRLRQVDQAGGPGVLGSLRGKLDFERVGIMGHSRGGQAVSYAIKYNMSRKGVTEQNLVNAIWQNPGKFSNFPALVSAAGTPETGWNSEAIEAAMSNYNMFYAAGGESTPPYNIRAGIVLAPTDFNLVVGVNNVPLAAIVPSCDGDVKDLGGIHAFEHNRFGTEYDSAPRFQVLVHGANHNYYNTTWLKDDMDQADETISSDLRSYCSVREGGPRLSSKDQRRGGTFLINSFMRYFVGGETQFASYWNGTARLPAQACPAGQTSCDERVALTVQKGSSQSMLLQRFMDSNALMSNALGGAITFTGFDRVSACTMPYSPTPWYQPICNPVAQTEFTVAGRLDKYANFQGGGYLSISDAAHLAWSQPNATISTDLKGVSAAGYDSLTFRVAVVRPMGQEVVVTLTDANGKSATLNASDFSDALYLAPKAKGAGRPLVDDPEDAQFSNTGAAPQVLNMVAIPLAAFTGVDKTQLARVDFAMPKASGMIAFTDLEFQNLGRPAQ